MISPTIGRVILVNSDQQGATGPWPCFVTKVYGDRCINAAGFNEWGTPVSYSSLPLIQDNDTPPTAGAYAEWMPYQKGQAAKTEALERQITGAGSPKLTRYIVDHLVAEDPRDTSQDLVIAVIDQPGHGGANHHYVVESGDYPNMLHVKFQNGPIKESGVNGVTHEALIAVLCDRLRGFQSGPYACSDNAVALSHLELAQETLQKRTRERLARGVEGTHQI